MDEKTEFREKMISIEIPERIAREFAARNSKGTGRIPWDFHWEIIMACRDALQTEARAARESVA